MGDISKHFSVWEWECACKLCDHEYPRSSIIFLLEWGIGEFQDVHPGKKISVKVSGGNRCPDHNEDVQKEDNPGYVPWSSKSRHMKRDAGDVKFYVNGKQIPPKAIYNLYNIYYPTMLGLGQYDDRTHIDVRLIRARWDKRTKK